MIQKNRDKRNYVIGFLLILVLFMTVGFAAFNTLLTINGTASIASSWCVGFDNRNTSAYEVTKGVASGTNPTASMTYSGTACSSYYVPNSTLTANFYQPGDKVEYTLTIVNKSNMTAAIESIEVNGSSVTSNQTITDGNIIWKVYMPEDTTLASNATTTMKVSAEFQNTTNIGNMSSGESSSLTVGVNVVQDDGNGGMDITPSAFSGTLYAINTNEIYKDSSRLQDIGTTYNSCLATGKNVCLKYTLEDDVVIGSEVCFLYNSTEYCLVGADEGEAFSTNQSTLTTAFGSCNFEPMGFVCFSSPWHVSMDDNDDVLVTNDSWRCHVFGSGDSYCG